MIGKTISHYKIVSKLGEGGMGEVWEAHDSRLDRTVAVKLIPKHLSANAEARKRFVHEAKAASSIEHANICTIHEIDETPEGETFIVMPRYQGELLLERIAGGRLPLEESLRIVEDLAGALAEAHDHDIIHRDVKPANIIVDQNGRPILLDFGLAKLTEQTKVSKTGTTVGTLAYMAPEQAAGKKLDGRADLFSLGVVLYELVTGVRPFRGEHDAAILYSIAHEPAAPLASHDPSLPAALQSIVDCALAKEPDERYASSHDFKGAIADLRRQVQFDLTRLRRDLESRSSRPYSPTVPSLASKRRRINPAWTVAIVIGMAAATLLVLHFRGGQTVDRPPPTHRQITFTGDAHKPAISGDGTLVAFLTGGRVIVHDTVGENDREIVTGVESCSELLWSPDGNWLLFAGSIESPEAGSGGWEGRGRDARWTGSGLAFRIPPLGGERRPVEYHSVLAWSPASSRLAGSSNFSTSGATPVIRFYDVGSSSLTSSTLSQPLKRVQDFDWSPSCNLLVCMGRTAEDQAAFWVGSIDGTVQQTILEESAPQVRAIRWCPPEASLYYLLGSRTASDLMKLRLDARTATPRREAVPILTGLQVGDDFSVSSDSRTLAYTREIELSNLWLTTIGGSENVERRQLTFGSFMDLEPSISPNGDRIAFSRRQGKNSNIHLLSLKDGSLRQLTFLDGRNECPVWSPDGEGIAFGSTHDGNARVWVVGTSAGSPRPLSDAALGTGIWLAWSPGNRILYVGPDGNNIVSVSPLTEEIESLVEADAAGTWYSTPRVAPDGTRLALQLTRHGTAIVVKDLDDPASRPSYMTRSYGFGYSDQTVDALEYRGSAIVLKAMVRAEVEGERNHGQLWLRIDGKGGETIYHDDMQDRPITSSEWREYEIPAIVGSEAVTISFGGRLTGVGRVWLDDFRLLVREGESEWRDIPIQNPGFEEPAAQSLHGWGLFSASFGVNRNFAAEGEQSLKIEWLREDSPMKAVPLGWSSDGLFLYVQNGLRVLRIPIEPGPAELVFESLLETESARNVTRDGFSIVTEMSRILSDVWIVENFDPDIR